MLFESQGRGNKQKAVELEDIKFHQCVRLARFENDRTISFIPPDGAFDLMTYRISQNIKPLIFVECEVRGGAGGRSGGRAAFWSGGVSAEARRLLVLCL